MNRFKLETIVFTCGAVVMMVELAGSRVLAPYLGTSVYVWTSLIGVILGSLSIGYWWGGRLADRTPSLSGLSKIILAAAVALAATAVLHAVVLLGVRAVIHDIRWAAVVATVLLFSPLSVLLGLISPYAVRLRMADVRTAGATVGRLSALATAGSIVGTFLAGFFVISLLGTVQLLLCLVLVLLLLALYTGAGAWTWRKTVVGSVVATVTLLGFYSPSHSSPGLVDLDTRYNRVWIRDGEEPGTGKRMRFLISDPYGAQSSIYLDEDTLAYRPGRYFRLVTHFRPAHRRALLIGGAPFSHPMDYLKIHPEGRLDIVEIDDGLTRIARDYFNFADDPRIQLVHEDGRTYLNRNRSTYEVVFVDAFGATFSPPFQLTTREAIGEIARSLDDDGLVLVNLLSSLEGTNSQFLRALYWTYREVFPQVHVIPMHGSEDTQRLQGILLIASKRTLPLSFESSNLEFQSMLANRWTRPIPNNLPILTDEYAPVEDYLKSLQMSAF